MNLPLRLKVQAKLEAVDYTRRLGFTAEQAIWMVFDAPKLPVDSKPIRHINCRSTIVLPEHLGDER